MTRIIGNQIITMMYHIQVCTQNNGAFGDGFEAVRKEGPVEAIGQRIGVSAIIGHKQRKCNIGMELLRFHDSACGKTVEIPISPDNKVRHAIFRDMALNSLK